MPSEHEFLTRTGKKLSLDRRSDIVRYVVGQINGQGVQCLHPTQGVCAYRSGDRDTRACAVGWLIPDDVWRQVPESFHIGSVMKLLKCDVVREHFFGDEPVSAEDLAFLDQLQMLHDRIDFWNEDRSRLDFRAVDLFIALTTNMTWQLSQEMVAEINEKA